MARIKVSKAFGSRYLQTADIPEEGRDLTIASLAEEKIGGDHKYVLYFREEALGLPLNKTNAEELASMFGDDSDDWIGEQVNVFQAFTQYQGRRTPCTRMRSVDPTPKAS